MTFTTNFARKAKAGVFQSTKRKALMQAANKHKGKRTPDKPKGGHIYIIPLTAPNVK